MSSAKQAILQQVQQEAALANARNLVNSVNNSCFERCVPKPGDGLSSTEQSCHTMCMEKYMRSWDAVSRAYVQRLQKEQSERQMLGGFSGGFS